MWHALCSFYTSPCSPANLLSKAYLGRAGNQVVQQLCRILPPPVELKLTLLGMAAAAPLMSFMHSQTRLVTKQQTLMAV